MRSVPARYLLTPGLLLLAVGLFLLAQLTPETGYVPLLLLVQLIMGFGAGLNGTPAIFTAVSGAASTDTGVASAMSSTSNQIGASIGTAALSTIAASATASFMLSHPEAASVSGLVHGFATATGVGAAIVFVASLLVGVLVDADPRRDART